MEVDNQPNIWLCSQRAIQRKLISKHLILFHNDRNEKLERKLERKLYKIKNIDRSLIIFIFKLVYLKLY